MVKLSMGMTALFNALQFVCVGRLRIACHTELHNYIYCNIAVGLVFFQIPWETLRLYC